MTAVMEPPATAARYVTEELITPQRAGELLEANPHNRSLRPAHVQRLAGAISRGEWVANGDTIKLTDDDEVVDGQHRLAAVIECGIAITVLVVRGVDFEAQATMDNHARRNIADLLSLMGETNTAVLGAALRYLWAYDTYGSMRNVPVQPTHQQLLDHLSVNPSLRESVHAATAKAKHLGLTVTTQAAIHCVIARTDPEQGEAFYTELSEGTRLDASSPVYKLRRFAIRLAYKRPKPTPVMQAALTIKAYNYWLMGEEPTLLVWKGGGASKEEFPQISTVAQANLME